MEKIELIKGGYISLRNGTLSDLIFIEEVNKKGKVRQIKVRCRCGSEFISALAAIRRGVATQCKTCRYQSVGMKKQSDLSGKRFGRLLVLAKDGRYRQMITYNCVCDCGKFVEGVIGCNLTTGNTLSCGCYHKERIKEINGSNWSPGDVIGYFVVIQKLPTDAKRNQRYLVLNTLTGRMNTGTAGLIQSRSTDQGYLKYLLRLRLRNALQKSAIPKSLSIITDLPWTIQDILTQIGPKLEGNYHLDHICPLNQAHNEKELILLNNPINLQWLSASENISKSDHKTSKGVALCRLLLGREWDNGG